MDDNGSLREAALKTCKVCGGWFRLACDRLLIPLVYADPSPAEAILSLTALWWAVVLIGVSPFQEGATNFHQLLFIHAPRWLWAMLFSFLGGGIIVARLKDWRVVERWLAFGFTGVWAFITALLLRVSPLSFATGTYAFLAMVAGWAHWRLRYE